MIMEEKQMTTIKEKAMKYVMDFLEIDEKQYVIDTFWLKPEDMEEAYIAGYKQGMKDLAEIIKSNNIYFETVFSINDLKKLAGVE